MILYLTGAAEELTGLPPGLGLAPVGFPDGVSLPPGREGALVLGERPEAGRAGSLASRCRRQGFSALVSEGGSPSPLELLRFCDALLRRGISPILPEENWVPGCGGAMLVSTALSGGSLEERLRQALKRCPDLALDLERLRRRFPLPCPDGQGEPISREELEGYLRRGAKAQFSRELMCKAFPLEDGEDSAFVLFDDRETLTEKVRLAEALGVGRGFLLLGEWSAEDAAAALEAAEEQGKSPAISG
jgi:hypothetical protein